MSKKLEGIGIGSGISIAKAFLLKDPIFNYSENSNDNNPDKELKNYEATCEKVFQEIENLIEISKEKISEEKSEIFKAHLEMAKDVQIQDEIKELIRSGKSQAWSINQIFDKYKETFENMENDYFKERASDIKDLKKRFMSVACNEKLPDLLLINEECIIVANDLSPSETAILDKKYVMGFVTNIGGKTSHSAIMAKTLEIPAIVSLKNITEQIKDGEKIALDAQNGLVETQLNDDDIKEWEKKKQQFQFKKAELEKFKKMECLTKCNHKITIRGNIGHPKDLGKVIENGGDGVGLFRSEFLYMESQNWPTEDEQFESYKQVLENSNGNEITIRTLDIGGDKHLNYFTFPHEMNPFLGYRAIRLSLDKTEIFETQLRALLRASVYGKLKIMFPMITTVDEFIKAKGETKRIEEKLKQEGVNVSSNYKIGMMVEVPSSAILAKTFAKYSDFFSIGSNDLIQYTHAVDRMSEEINYLYQPNNPSILNLIKMTVDGGKSCGKEVSVCGEMANNHISAILLVGLGVSTLSMSASEIPKIKKILSQVTMKNCQDLAFESINLESEKEVNNLVLNFFKKNQIDI